MDHSEQTDRLRVKANGRRRRRRSAKHLRASRGRRRRRRGLTAIEYCFMLSLIFIGVLLAVQHLGSMLKSSINHSESEMQKVGVGQ